MRTSSATNVGADKDSETRQRVARLLSPPGPPESNGVRTVVVEDASRFARDLVAQELGVLLLIKRGVRVLTANGDDLTDTSDPSRVMMRQIAGSFAQYEKTRLVTKLRGARERVREAKGKCEGRKSYADRQPELVVAAKRLHRRSSKGYRRSLREIASELATMGTTQRPTVEGFASAHLRSITRRYWVPAFSINDLLSRHAGKPVHLCDRRRVPFAGECLGLRSV
jgi:DNA invertase Pin-like site-specific DNA recombinase